MKVFPSAVTTYFESLKRMLDVHPLVVKFSIDRERISELGSLPHHYHLPAGVKESKQISLQELLEVIPNFLE